MVNTETMDRCPNCALPLLRPKDAVGLRTARVEELLRQNHPPLDVELSDFRKVAEDTLSALEDLESKIVEARESLENLLSARQQAQSRLEDVKSILHPIRSLPSELLAQVFRYCIPTTYRAEGPDALDPKGAPWLLARVCHRWRELAVNTPQLWTHLFLDFDKHLGHITELQCAYKTGLFIRRSRGLLMEVDLGSAECVAGHPVLPVLEVSIPQWRYLKVDLPRTSLQSLSGNSLLNLQRLQLRSDESDFNTDVFQPMRVPVLREFEVRISGPWHDFEHFPFPWPRLTSLTRFPAFDVGALNYLRTMTELMDLDVLAGSEIRTPIRDVLSLSKLCCLTITESEDAAGRSKEFFSALAIPALLELTLEYHATSVLHFPTSPLPLGNLINLDVTCDMNSHSENTQHLLNFLTLTHHVECLRLYDLNMTVEFADGLNLNKTPDGSPVRLSCLCSLDIHGCGFAPALYGDLDQLFEMLYSRLPAVTVERNGAVNSTASCKAGMDGNGQSAATNETKTEFDPRSRDHGRRLKMVRFPRWLYVQTRTEWQDIFLQLTSRAELECGVTLRDTDN